MPTGQHPPLRCLTPLANSRGVRTHRTKLWAPLLLAASCSSSTPGTAEDPDERRHRLQLLESLNEDVILPNYQAFQEATDELSGAAEAYSESPNETSLAVVQLAWSETMAVWQRAELHQIGPAGESGTVAAGQDLRELIYSWPSVNPCRVDQETLEENFRNSREFANESTNVTGLDALEYLLFHSGSDNACPVNQTINTSGEWELLAASPEQLRQRRADYAHTLSVLLEDKAQELLEAWRSSGDAFGDALTSPGPNNEYFASSLAAVNAVTDAAFYLDSQTKDAKLAESLGLGEGTCADDGCADSLESQYAHQSREHLLANLQSFQALFVGLDDEDYRFEDLLSDHGEAGKRLAKEMKQRLQDTMDAHEQLGSSPLSETLEADPGAVRKVHDKLQRLTTLLKTEFIELLSLQLPEQAQGDND